MINRSGGALSAWTGEAERTPREPRSLWARARSAIDSTITAGDNFGSVRFGFADDVVVQWLPDVDTDARDILSQLREAVLALARVDRGSGRLPRARGAPSIRRAWHAALS